MTDNKDFTEVFDAPATPLAREHAKRAVRRVKRRKKSVSKATRYTVSVLAIILVFFLAFSVGSWMIKLFSSPSVPDENLPEDPVTTLQKRLDELNSENQALSDEIEELQIKLDKYNELYGPLESPSGNSSDSSSDAQTSQAFTPDTNSSTSDNTPPVQTPAPAEKEVPETTTTEPEESLVEEL